MAQKYNPSTGQWEDEEEDNGPLSGGLSTVFGGSSPEMDGSAMTAGIPPIPESLPGGWKETYSGFTPDRENRVATVNNGDLLGAVREASYLPTSADKYTGRFTDYFNTAQDKLGENFSSVQMISDTDNTNWQNITAGPVYLGTTGSGKKYVIEVPHSPGGGFNDWKTSAADGWIDLGLGDLGGEGNEQIGYNAGASMIPFEQFGGFGPGAATVMDNVNPAGASFGDVLKKIAPMAILAAGGMGLAGMFGEGALAAGAGEAALGSLGSGTLGVDLAGLGTLGSTSAMAGTLGSGLSGTTLASLGLDAGALGGIVAGIGGLGLEGASGVISDIGSLVGDIAGFDPATMGYGMGDAISSVLDPSMINGLDPSAFMPDFSAINGYDMPYEALSGTDFGSPELFQPGSGALEGISPEYIVPDSYSSLEGVDPFETTDMVNKGWNRATGYGLDNMYGKNAFGIPQGTAQEIKNMYNFMTQPMGGQRPGLFQAPSPLNTLFRGVGALDSMKQNREAMDYLEKMRAGIDGNASNPNRPRGDFANQQWMNGISNPMAGYQDFMMGGGREFIDKARAAAAKGGRRGSYLNSGKIQSDLASLYMKNQIDRQNMIKGGFEDNVNDTSAKAAYDSAMVPMIKNQNAPLFQMLGNTGMQYGLSELFSGW
jgi:hypothetical protein